MKCLIFLFKIPKDNKDFFHKCRHDYEHHEIWHQQEMGNFTTLVNKKWVIYDFLKKIPLKKKGNPHSIPKEI
jgi:hypothetical protein